jgi:type I restriction enzyme S subunit
MTGSTSTDDLSAWPTEPLSRLIEPLQSGSRPKGGVRSIKDGVPSLGGEHLTNSGRFRVDNVRYVPRAFYNKMNRGHVQVGDVLIVKDGATTGKVALVGDDFPFKEAVVNEHVFICRPKPGNDSNYLFWYLFSPIGQERVLANFQGSAQGGINQSFADNTLVPIAPYDDQVRLATALQRSNTRVTSARSCVKATRSALLLFRRAVVAAACSGRLTADWRNDHEDDAERLLEDLRTASLSRKHPPALPDDSWLPPLPSNWAVTTLDLLIERIEAGKSFRAEPRPASLSEWGVVKVSAMSWGQFLEDENKALRESTQFQFKNEIRPGDLLISRANTAELVGATVLVGDTRPRLLLSDKSLRLVVFAGVDKSWLNFALQSQIARQQFASWATGTSDSMRNLSQPKILAVSLPLPPTAEQVEIAARVTSLLNAAEVLLARLAAADKRINDILNALLSKVFRGERDLTVASLSTEHQMESV